MMTVGFRYLFCLLCSIIELSNGQFSPPRNSNKSPCDDANKTAMVEHFFNVIFTEFNPNPPVCVCVQMCVDQPIYCYPNGCLKKGDNKKKNIPPPPVVTNVNNAGASKTMFLVDEKSNYAQMLNARADDSSNAKKITTSSDIFFDPLKDMYKTLFKNKKMPKVALRYNLREQVKNMKSGILKTETEDVSNSRWPKMHHRIFHDKKTYSKDKLSQKINTDTGKGKFFLVSPERSQHNYNSKYFKRELKRNDKVDLDSLIDEPSTTEKDFSIETLIEYLIGNTFETINDTKIDLKESLSVFDGNVTNLRLNTEVSSNGTIVNNIEEVCVVSMNATNENKDVNKYTEEGLVEEVFRKWSNYTFDEMISELSKQIDIHNNTSLEMMRRASGADHNTTTAKSSLTSAVVVDVEIEHKELKLNNNTIKVPKNDSTLALTNETTSQTEVKVI